MLKGALNLYIELKMERVMKMKIGFKGMKKPENIYKI